MRGTDYIELNMMEGPVYIRGASRINNAHSHTNREPVGTELEYIRLISAKTSRTDEWIRMLHGNAETPCVVVVPRTNSV